MPEPAWRTDVTGVVVHPVESSIWLPNGNQPELISAHDDFLWYPDVEPVLDALRARYGLDAIVLRCLEAQVDRTERHIRLTFLLQALSMSMPVQGWWLPVDSSAALDSVDESKRSIIAEALHALSDPPPPTRRPWTVRGWFEQAVAWADAALRSAGLTPNGAPVQVRTWGLSAVVRFDTARGNFYFKAAAPSGGSIMFANEAALLSNLAERFSDLVPRPVATDPDRVWMVLPDAGSFLADCEDLAIWESAIRRHACLQRSYVGQETELARYGCLDRRLPRLSAQFEALLDDDIARDFFDAPEWNRLRDAAAAAREAIARVEQFGIPNTLVHGDLHSGNVGVHEGRPVVFDWTDACIGHPFLDLVTLLDGSTVLDATPGARDRLRAAYLEEWRGVASEASLTAAADLIAPVGMLHQAVSYRQMLPDLDEPAHSDMGRGMAHWLRKLVASVEEPANPSVGS